MIAGGVFFGAAIVCQACRSIDGKVSDTVGTLGRFGFRRDAATAITFILFAEICGSAATASRNIKSIRPLMRSLKAVTLP
jgi:ABC-type transporter Mla maintaining outer membrane lipid asymmetry permease subunit MlaE